MEVNAALALLGGLSPAAFMRKHWQKQPLLVRQAWPGVQPPLGRAAMFALAGREGVESRLVQRLAELGAGPAVPAAEGAEGAEAAADRWSVRHGPLQRRALPPLTRPGWTLLLQGLDLHVPAAHAMLRQFAFLPTARLDDLMMSWASPGGGVGPHLDSYDVFLLQVQGARRWQVGHVAGHADAAGAAWQPGVPLKILRDFRPQHDWVLEPGDMLYLPPGWAHDGVAVGGDCMTCSVGFRAPASQALAAELLQRMTDDDDEDSADEPAPSSAPARRLYRDSGQAATLAPGAIPPALQAFARQAVARLVGRVGALERALGEVLSEPKPQVWFEPGPMLQPGQGLRLAAATRMLYDERLVYINGESFRASGRDARLMRRLADHGQLSAADLRLLSGGAATLVDDWRHSGWLTPERGSA